MPEPKLLRAEIAAEVAALILPVPSLIKNEGGGPQFGHCSISPALGAGLEPPRQSNLGPARWLADPLRNNLQVYHRSWAKVRLLTSV